MEALIKTIARNTIEKNILHIESQQYIVAGGNQFKTLWTRDFCYSVRGLLKAGYQDLVREQLKIIYQYKNTKDFLPRGLDVISPKLRVLSSILLPRVFKFDYPSSLKQFKNKIKAEYLGEHGTVPFDSNILFILAYFDYVELSKDPFLTFSEVESLLKPYLPYFREGLFFQPPFSDWQDSVKRSEPILLFHLLLLVGLRKINKFYSKEINFISQQELSNQILGTFYDSNTKLFYQDSSKSYLALDYFGILFTYRPFTNEINYRDVYESLKKSSLWHKYKIPGQPVDHNYASSSVSWTTKLVGLKHYHDSLHWGWLVAEAAKISLLMNDSDEFQRIIRVFFDELKERDLLAEVYLFKSERFRPFASWLYKSECPFTWTASKWFEAVG